ncbi:MAG: DHH family phosphoesterase [Prevotella sp.]|nr:DHH family phosphoesterase [Prevotella sp.]
MNINILSEAELKQLRSIIAAAADIVVIGHVNPDGDAIGSTLAWTNYLQSEGKSVSLIVPDKYPDFLNWLPNTDKILRHDKHPEKTELLVATADLIFCLDLNTLSRTEALADHIASAKAAKVLIDHHPNPDDLFNLTISHPEMSSTSELVFRLVWQLGAFERLGHHFAVPCYCGMMTDTGGFTFNSTRPEIFFIISQLLTKGIDKDKIYRNVYNVASESKIRLWGYVLYEKMEYDATRHAAFFTLTRADLKRFNYIKGDAEGLVNMPLQIKGTRLSISLREDTDKDNTVWVSLRSVDDFNCTEMAAAFFNGGGHFNASGGRLNCSIEEAAEITRKAIITFEDKLK